MNPPTRTTHLLVFSILCGLVPLALSFGVPPQQLLQQMGQPVAFSGYHRSRVSSQKLGQWTTALRLFWFSGKDDKKKKSDSESGSSEKRPGMGGVSDVMDSMDNFKKAQQVGKMTGNLVQELSSMAIEGVAADGRIRVFVDGQQRPTGVDIDESYLSTVTADELSAALTIAMQDAHTKSAEKMDEKMRSFYAEVGLPSS